MKLRIVALGAVMFALFAAVACGGDDNKSDATATRPATTSTRPSGSVTPARTSTPSAGGTATAPAGAATTAPTAAAGTDSVTIDARDFSFSPSTLTIKRANNTKITMTNSGSAPHQLKVYRDDAYSDAVPGAETQRVAGGASDDFTILSADIGSGDELYFRCEIHPSQMKGEITVQ